MNFPNLSRFACAALVACALSLGLVSPASAANSVEIRAAESSVPAALNAGATAAVRIRVVNNGTTTWSPNALYRLGALYSGAANQVTWSSFSCGGYMSSATDARAFLCSAVPPGGSQDITFNVTVPTTASGTVRLALRMVQDGVEWFGNSYSWAIAVGSSNLPDVVVDSVSVSPANPTPGQAVRFNAVVRNLGPAATPSGVTIGVGYFVDGAYKSWGSINGPLAAGASVTIGTQGSTWPATAGTHNLSAAVDDVNRFAESNEQNNTGQASFTVRANAFPDVIVTAVSAVPGNPAAGQQTSFSATVKNIGDASTPSGLPIGVGYFIDGAYKSWGSVSGPLAPGASVNVGTQGSTWAATPGQHQLTASVDDVNRFTESNEGNNSTSTALNVGTAPATASLYGLNIDPANARGNPTAAQMKALGAQWLRIEWKAERGYSLYDPVIAAYRAAGVRVMVLVDYTTVQPKPAWNAGDAAWQNYLPTFIAKVRELAQHYGDNVDAWEIWNEPDLFAPVAGYDPGVPARHFGAMLRDAVAAIRPFSTRPIVSGGVASRDFSYLDTAIAAAGPLTVDAVGVHPYQYRAPDNWPNTSWGFGNMSAYFDRYLTYGLPLWVTEVGTNEPARYADYLQNVYQLARDRYSGRVPVIFWFCWSDGMVDPFGLVDRNGAQKAGYVRFRDLAPH